MAAATASFVEYWLLRRALRSADLGVTILRGRWRVMVAAAASGAAGFAVRPLLSDFGPLVAGVVVVGVAGAAYLGVAWRLGIPETRKVLQLLARRTGGGSDREP